MNIDDWVASRLKRATGRALGPMPQSNMPIGPLEPIPGLDESTEVNAVSAIMDRAISGALDRELGLIIKGKKFDR